MIPARGWAALDPKSPLGPWAFERRDPRPKDVVLDVIYCGVCHSDLHQARDEWGGSVFPMVPGHEIVGRVSRVGAEVSRFRAGDLAGVGCVVDSCRTCAACAADLEQHCEDGPSWTYNSTERDKKTPTQGGYSTQVVVHEDFALRVADGQPLERVAPLLCAGITTYSPLRHWKVEKGQRVLVMGLGGLGHMAVRIASAMGAEVVVASSGEKKRADAARLGAADYVVSGDAARFAKLARSFHLAIDTISAPHAIEPWLRLLRLDGTLVVVGIPERPMEVPAFPLIGARRSLAGSLVGGLRETQEMLDFCAKHGVLADVEVIPMKDIEAAYERMKKGDVRYRFVIDASTIE